VARRQPPGSTTSGTGRKALTRDAPRRMPAHDCGWAHYPG
jgi:hypothetical protein